MNDRPSDKWRNLSNDELAELDLRQFIGGENPYGEHDNSIGKAFSLGKSTMEEIVRERVGCVGGRVLDLMSGAGRWLPFLADANVEVVAIERIEDCNRIARGLCAHFGLSNVDIRTGDITRIEESADGSFDFVWMWSGLQYVERAYALRQIARVLKPGGRVFIGAYNGAGLMVEHVVNGAENGALFGGASQWALSALARGVQDDGNPNFMDLEECEALCRRFGLSLVAAAPQLHLDLRQPDGRASGWEQAPRTGRYVRTVEFLAERTNAGGVIAARSRDRGLPLGGWRRWSGR